MGCTLVEKIWASHVVGQRGDGLEEEVLQARREHDET
jgi:hypothetical protein